ncbi:DUF2334 domain-containing protein [Methanothermococcus okinawensis]|uniref:Polysaccharide deacetylase n=1 Tax=Methanothermococcus okinawensis (strain DSM 14208 / JCM 11175 / IH1) TaxID=647113 RepID=F8AKE3_METOI|nr:DUF2334 domain-containing protein [Methanothermococcus okinawensis]AEH06343.1 polysaccharide deacetylase [Methanothermococcus okinawensis IH1]
MYKKILYSFILLISMILLILSFNTNTNTNKLNHSINTTAVETINNISNNIYNCSGNISNKSIKPIILVHDVSPAYFDDIKKIVSIIDKYNYSKNTILFVIPDLENPPNGGKWDLRKNKEFVNYLHQLEKRGYKIELHGYKHTYHEFNCSEEEASKKLHDAETIMSECGFNNMTLFLPPAWALNNESTKVLLNHNYTIILTDKLIYPNNTIEKITNKEYTWYIQKNITKIKYKEYKALSDYHNSQYQFYISVHPKPACYGGGLVVLDYFLNKTK